MKQQNTKKTLPEWTLKFNEPCTEIHAIGGRYYLYKYTYTYNKETQRHKKHSVLVGRLVEGIGLVEKGSTLSIPRKARKKKKVVLETISDNVEYGISYWMAKQIKPLYYKSIETQFGICWQTIIAISFCRLVFQSPICDMQRHFSNSFLKQMLPDAKMGDKDITDVLSFIGRHRESQVKFFDTFSSSGNIVIFDGTLHQSESLKMYLPQYTKLKDGSFGYGINVVNGFSVTKQMPAYMRCLPGNIKDVKAIKLCLKEFKKEASITALFDKGFFSKSNIEMLQKMSVKYILPLRRSVNGKGTIDYDVFNRHDRPMTLFSYESRNILCCEMDEMYGSHVYLYLDDELQYKERHDAQVRLKEVIEKITQKKQKEEKKKEKGKEKFSNKPSNPDMDTIQQDDFTAKTETELWAEYYEREKMFGTIIIITNSDFGAEDTYRAYKSRDQVEKMIDVTKSVLDEDTSHMQNQDVYNGWMFCNFIALHWYYILRNMLVESEQIKHFSAQNILTELGYHQIVKVNGEWTVVERTKKQQNILDKLGFSVTYPYD